MPRQRPHLKIRTSIRNHRKADFWADPKLRGIWVELCRLAVERFADRTGDSFLCSSSDLMYATGASRPHGAVMAVKSLVSRSTVGLESEGSGWRVTLPNFAQKQGFKPTTSTETEVSASATPTATIKPHTENGSGASLMAESWPRLQRVAGGYGVRWSDWTRYRATQKTILARLAECDGSVDALEAAIHGYVELRRSPDFPWRKHLVPKTIFRASNFADYLTAGEQIQKSHQTPEDRSSWDISGGPVGDIL